MENTEVGRPEDAFALEFFRKAVPVGLGKSESHDFIKIIMDNGNTEIVHDLDSGSQKADQYKQAYGQRYEQWIKLQVNKPIGYPLEKLFENDPAKAEMYAFHKIYTVEQLAAQSDANLQPLGLDARDDREKAREFVSVMKSAKNVEPLMVKQNALEAANKQLEADKLALAKRLEALEAKINAKG